ncbi:hypothetical protein GCM10022381_04090 [Leifsonia kafniensis]|uniref:Uncharacterized protein n=1 Tax=Leifsonia kafniensis TaxID=475957 RepID=A0ABP7K214_9MICO
MVGACCGAGPPTFFVAVFVDVMRLLLREEIGAAEPQTDLTPPWRRTQSRGAALQMLAAARAL